MRLSRTADYALRAMIYMAGLPEGTAASGSVIAEATGIAEPFLQKILRQIVKARLIQAQRGAKGGFQLAISAEQISMLRVIEAVEGPLSAGTCMADDIPCDRKAWCGVHVVLAELQQQMIQALQRTSIDRLRRDSEVRREFVTSIAARQGA